MPKGLTPSGKNTPAFLLRKNKFVFLNFFQSFRSLPASVEKDRTTVKLTGINEKKSNLFFKESTNI